MSTMSLGSLGDLRDQIEGVAFDPDLPDSTREAILVDLRGSLTELTGRIDQYLREGEKLASAMATGQQATVAEARQNADYRTELLGRALATPEELDSWGYASHEELDRLDEEGLLIEAAMLLTGRARQIQSLSLQEARGEYAEKLHPRDRLGKWRKKLGIKVGATSVGGHYKVTGPKGELAVKATKAEAEAEADKIAARYADAAEKSGGRPDPGALAPYSALPEDVASSVPDPPLLAKARSMILGDAPTTRDRYSKVVKGRRVYDESRRAKHEEIIEAFLRMDDQGEPGRGPRRRPPTDRKPQAFFTGGGFASGKGGVVGGEEGSPRHRWFPPEGAIVLDPDKIKALLPEFGDLQRAGDPEANLRVYEEAWDIAQAVAKRIQDEKLDVVVDGVGDTSAEEAIGRAKSYIDAGFDTPRAVYVFTPADIAIHNARRRMQLAIEADKLESIRYIPEDLMRDVHGDVSRIFPDVFADWPGEIEVYDTNTFDPDLNDGKGGFNPPILFALKDAEGNTVIRDKEKWGVYVEEKAKLSQPNAPGKTVGPEDVA